ncbi:hypothetical protein ID866_3241 [Astraeus odoratus]|nr:hypothetical protein ID866_3241 [Astraeus odoratus]
MPIAVYYGPVINPKSLTCYQALPRCLMAVGPEGNISWIEEDVIPCKVQDTLAKHGLSQGDYAFVELKEGEFIMPGFIDTHITTKDLVAHIHKLSHSPAGEPYVHPVITPRFAMSCTPDLLTELGHYAQTVPHVAIQTHISENKQEVQDTLEMFKATSYAGIYDEFKLLRHNTILGHGVYLTDDDIRFIARRGAGVAHCPASNFNLSSGIAKVGKLLDCGVKVGLGTDVSGGNNPSMLYAIQMASTASKMLAIQENAEQDGTFTNKKFDTATLLYLATMGGAEVCCLEKRIGSFEKGKAFDALVVSVRDETGNPAIWGYNPERDLTEGPYAQSAEKNLKEWLQRFFYCGDDRNIRRVFVQGILIGGQEFQ